MALDRTFAAAFIDNDIRHRILGRRLKPFSLWHRYLLDAIHSPFLYGDELRLWDMREAIGICSLSYSHSKIHRPWLVPFICMILFGLPRSQWTRFLKRTRNKLLDYFGDYITRPEYTIKGPESPPGPVLGPIPEGFIIVCDVISFLKCSEKEAWDLSVAKAYWYQMGSYRKEQIDFMTEDERKFQADAAERLKKKEAA